MPTKGMVQIYRPAIYILLALVICWGKPVYAEENNSTSDNGFDELILTGEVIALEISKVTGFAISPILGISVLGAYTYYTTPPAERGQVPWHARVEFWGPLLAVLLGIILKDSSKVALPKVIMMPLDAIETLLEKNVSAVLGLLVILSSITGRGMEQLQLAGHEARFSLVSTAYADISAGTVAPASTGVIELGMLTMLVTVVFGLVWVVSQSFNFLIFLCPSSWLDLLLTTFKNTIIAVLLGATLIHPFLGLLVSGIIIAISVFLFAKSYRFVIFGTMFSSDILLKKYNKDQVKSTHIKAFSSSALSDIPSLSYGKLSAQNSKLVFHYRPWLVMPGKSVSTSYDCEECNAGIGTLSPVIVMTGKNDNSNIVLFRLRPLYKSHEDIVAEKLGLRGIKDVAFGKSLRDGYNWLKEQLGLVKPKQEAIPS